MAVPPEHLAELVTCGAWPEVLAALARLAEADAALAIGPGQKWLGAIGVTPWTTEGRPPREVDPAVVEEQLRASGFQGVWVRALGVSGRLAILAVASRTHEISMTASQQLDGALPLLVLGVELAVTRTSLEEEGDARRKLESRISALEHQSLVGTVAAGIAHDLAAPISALVMQMSDLRRRVLEIGLHLPEPGPVMAHLLEDLQGLSDSCTEATDRARGLLDEFRLAAQPAGDDVVPMPVLVADALRACIRLVAASEPRVRLETNIDGRMPAVTGSRSRLKRAFTNLLVNAVQAAGTRDDGLVTVKAVRDGRELILEFGDNGGGVPAEARERIFAPYFTTKPKGTGLGLAITREIIEQHGGRIEVSGEAGQGALFRVRLPLPAAAAVLTPAGRNRARVLIVDDDAHVARALERQLRTDYDAVLASDGRRALDILESGERFDALIVDLGMPIIDGPELFSRIKLRWPGMESRIVFGTGGPTTARARAFLDSVPNQRFEKPISRDELRPIMQRLVGGPR
jgi:two-component system, NtrC family, sensor kinase